MHEAQYWVVGGEYTSTEFRALIDGTARVLGPFDDRVEAERTWRSLSEEHRPQAQVRFTIVQEPAGRAAST